MPQWCVYKEIRWCDQTHVFKFVLDNKRCWICITSFVPGDLTGVFMLISLIADWGISPEFALMWLSLDVTGDRPTYCQALVWCLREMQRDIPHNLHRMGHGYHPNLKMNMDILQWLTHYLTRSNSLVFVRCHVLLNHNATRCWICRIHRINEMHVLSCVTPYSHQHGLHQIDDIVIMYWNLRCLHSKK